jgi:hypothetical protein
VWRALLSPSPEDFDYDAAYQQNRSPEKIKARGTGYDEFIRRRRRVNETALIDKGGILPVQFYEARRHSDEAIAATTDDWDSCWRCPLLSQAHIEVGMTKKFAKRGPWMFGKYPEFYFSFASVCAELGISPDRLKKRLLLDNRRITSASAHG